MTTLDLAKVMVEKKLLDVLPDFINDQEIDEIPSYFEMFGKTLQGLLRTEEYRTLLDDIYKGVYGLIYMEGEEALEMFLEDLRLFKL